MGSSVFLRRKLLCVLCWWRKSKARSKGTMTMMLTKDEGNNKDDNIDYYDLVHV